MGFEQHMLMIKNIISIIISLSQNVECTLFCVCSSTLKFYQTNPQTKLEFVNFVFGFAKNI